MFTFLKNLLFLFTGKSRGLKSPEANTLIRKMLHRRSCRSFSPEDLSDAQADIIIEAGRYAPSTVNLQTWSFITFTRQQWRDMFQRPIPFNGARAIVVCADLYRLKDCFPDFQKTPCVNYAFAIFNAGLAAMNMTIAAEALGLASIMLSETGQTGLLDIAHLQKLLHLPRDVLPLTTLVVGKRAANLPGIPPRQPRESTLMNTSYNHEAPRQLQEWLSQMSTGYRVTHPLSSLDKQLELYQKKMKFAEAEVRKRFLPDDTRSS